MTDMKKLLKITEKYNIPVIEDSCQSILAAIDNKNAGTWGEAGAFSLHPLKNLHVHGDGGVLVTENEALYRRVLMLRNHGLSNRESVELWGYNSRLDGIQAAILSVKLKYIEEWNNSRLKNALLYNEKLAGIDEIIVQLE